MCEGSSKRRHCVGGRVVGKGTLSPSACDCAGFGSPFGSGGAKSRRRNYTGVVDTVYLGTWRRADLIALSGFDERLVRNQDDELCLRITRSGGTMWQSRSIRAYICRAIALANYGISFTSTATGRRRHQEASEVRFGPATGADLYSLSSCSPLLSRVLCPVPPG